MGPYLDEPFNEPKPQFLHLYNGLYLGRKFSGRAETVSVKHSACGLTQDKFQKTSVVIMTIPHAAIWGIVHGTAKSGYLSTCNWGMSYKPSAMWVSNQTSSNPRLAILKRVKISLQLQFLRLKKQKICRSKGVWSRINHSGNSNGCYFMFLTEAKFFSSSLFFESWFLLYSEGTGSSGLKF